nr:MAG TPA: hypothetical protein [Caudoviricetes sp.]
MYTTLFYRYQTNIQHCLIEYLHIDQPSYHLLSVRNRIFVVHPLCQVSTAYYYHPSSILVRLQIVHQMHFLARTTVDYENFLAK